MTHICVGNLTIIGPDNGLSPGRRQAIILTNAGILLIGPWGTNFSEILIGIHTFSFKKIRLKMSSAKCCSFRLGLNVLKVVNHLSSTSQYDYIEHLRISILFAIWIWFIVTHLHYFQPYHHYYTPLFYALITIVFIVSVIITISAIAAWTVRVYNKLHRVRNTAVMLVFNLR